MSQNRKAELISSEVAAEQNFTTDNILRGSCVECGCTALIFYHYDDGQPVPEAPFILTDSNNKKLEGKTDRKGLCLIEEMPCGAFELLLDEGSDEFRPKETEENNPVLQVKPEYAAIAGEYFTLFTLLRNKGFIEYDADDSSERHIDIDDASLFLNVPDEYEPAYERFWELNDRINRGSMGLREAIYKIHVSLPAEVVSKAGDNSAILLFCEIALGFIPVVGQAMDIYDLGEWGWQTYTQAALRSDPMHWAIGGLVLVGFVPGVGDALKKSGKAIIEALAKNSPEAIQAGIKMLRGLSNGNLVKFLNSFADKIKDAGAKALELLQQIIDGLKLALVNGGHWILRLMKEAFGSLIDIMVSMAGKLKEMLDWVCNKVKEFIGKVVTRLTGTPRPKKTEHPEVDLNAGKDAQIRDMSGPTAEVDASNQALPGAKGKCTNGCPIDMATGHVVDWRTDFSLPGILALGLKRFYYSGPDVEPGMLGRRWRADWDMSLVLSGDQATFTDGEYNQALFVIPEEGAAHRAAHMPQWRLCRIDGLLVMRHLSGIDYTFNHALGNKLMLTAISDQSGNRHHFVYDRGQLKGILLSDGRRIKVKGSRRRIERLELQTADGKALKTLVAYEYNDKGYLTSCRADPGHSFDYQYSDEGWLLRWQDMSCTWVEHDYDSQGRAIRSRGADKRFCDALHYDDDNRIVYYRSPLDGIKIYHRDERNNIIRVVLPNGDTTYNEWQDNQLVSQRNQLGEQQAFKRDEWGQLTELTQADGSQLKWQYDEAGRLLSFTNELGASWQHEYDSRGNLLSVLDPLGHSRYWQYNSKGQMAWAIDADGEQTGFGYDKVSGLPCEVILPGVEPLKLEYDNLGRISRVLQGIQSHKYTYLGQSALVTGVVDSQGKRQHFEYDTEGNLVKATDANGNSQQYRYGAFDLLQASIDPLGHELQLFYNGECQFAGIANSKGEQWRYHYNSSGQIVEERHLDGRRNRFDYDKAGRVICKTQADGSSIHFFYDICGRLLQKQTRNSQQMVMNNSHFEYDGAGQLLKGRNAVSELAFSYDALGRLIAETQNGQSIEYQYTAAGRPIRANGLLLEQQQTWQHGRLATIAASGFEPLTLAYDRYGRETSRSNQAGFCLQQEYTPEGLLKRQHLDAWSPQGTEQQLSGRFGGIARSYEYDALSRITAIEDGHWGRSEFTQNALGQIVAEKRTSAWNARSERRQFSYDSELQLTAIASWAEDGQNKDQLSNSSPNSTSNSRIIDFAKKRQEKALEYQQAGRVVRQGDNVFRYDANGRMVEKTLKRDGFRAQTSFYHWDEEDRLIRVSLPNGDIWHYEYDVFGRRCRKYRQQPATQPTSAQSLTQQISQGDIRYQWLGDQLSQQQSYYADGSVATTQWLYEPGSFRPLAQIRQLDTPNDPGRPELHYAVTDLAGNVRELCDPQGQIHWRGEQGLWQDFHQWRLSGTPKKYLEQAANEPLHCDLRYQGQIYDRETGLYYNRHRYYDPEICQYLSPDPIGLAGGTRPQAYVHNPLEWVDPLGLSGCPEPESSNGIDKTKHFDRETITDGFQDHHIISDKNKLTRNHELLDLAEFDLQKRQNKIFLPTDESLHPTRSIHRGRHTTQVSRNLAEQMDAVVEVGKQQGWTKPQYRKALDSIISQERQLLRSGHRALNKNQRPWAY
ncbi:RHS repeat-associated core domain-containing protein [Shewanella algae]|uniref:RHS repeat-associated core domain-containing protein n=2 Tax=Shewanella algae TaxID=38313 RepID=UPI001BEF3D97|nr:RHS repeat-associated core domain-containing protein [Shewanella algae]BCV62866.1 hypothetical protein TUM17386_25370 [Shewanella algae]